jgi:isoleucyl-tRNA synthetase
MKTITKQSNFIKFPELEQNISKFWTEKQIFKKTLDQRTGQERFAFMDGPPFVSGVPHYASLLPTIAKDVIPRYQTMKGKYVRRVFGWDCHGLPIEEQVNKKFGLRTHDDVVAFGIKKYIEECRSFVTGTTQDWQTYITKTGRFVDMDNAYYTMNPEFNESVLWLFKKAWDQGFIYKGNRVSLFSVDNQTPVSDFEINMDPSNYKDTDDIAIFAKLPITKALDQQLVGTNLLIWTTTPWTIPAHMCMAYNSQIEYVLVAFEGQKYITATSCLENVFQTTQDQIGTDNGKLVQILKILNQEELQSIEYKPVYNYYNKNSSQGYYKLYEASFVTDTDGTGLVHIAGQYGKEDNDLVKQNKLELLESITVDGLMLWGNQKNVPMRQALEPITKEIDDLGYLFRSHLYTHRLPYYRGANPLIYMAQDSYFIDIQKIKPRMIELNESINWYPEHYKKGRFLDVITTAPDWCISRNRFWATIMPLWQALDGEQLVIGSIAEMMEYTDQITKVGEEYQLNGQKLFLHRDFCDQIILTKNNKKFYRVPEVLDCWLDSGSVPFAEFGYPFKNQTEFEESFPADYIVEYTGQLRAWFNALLRVSVIAFDKPAFKNAVVTGVLAGSDGRKMSKSFKNFPDPIETLNNIGGEALRLYMMGSSIMSGEDVSWSDEILNEQTKNILIPFWNTFTYFTIYASMYNYTPTNSDFVTDNNILDKWLESRVNLAVTDFSTALDNYNFPEAVKTIRPVIDDISTWYIRRSRDRFASGDTKAMQNLYASLVLLIKAFAPQMPFVTERMYQEIVAGVLVNAKESVHMEDYPSVTTIDNDLLVQMQKLRALASMGLALRTDYKLSLRQPIARVYSDLESSELLSILRSELNAKETIQTATIDSKINGVEFKQSPDGIVGIDTVLSVELLEEGVLADLQRKIQNARKNMGLQMGQLAILHFVCQEQKVVDFMAKFSLILSSNVGLKSVNQVKSFDSLVKTEKIKFMDTVLEVSFEV